MNRRKFIQGIGAALVALNLTLLPIARPVEVFDWSRLNEYVRKVFEDDEKRKQLIAGGVVEIWSPT